MRFYATKIGMNKAYISASLVPKQLTEDQKPSRVIIAKIRFNHDKNKFLNCIVTGDEMLLIVLNHKSSDKAKETSCFCWQGYAGCF